VKNFVFILVFLSFSPFAFATSPFDLPTLDPSQTDAVFRTLASGVAFRPVQPASSDGIFGFSLGLTALQASTNQITSLVGPGTPNLYDGDISGTLQFPFGLALEVGWLPSVTISGISVSRLGGDIKWTFTDLLFSNLPFSAALRAAYTTAYLSYSQALNGGSVNVNYNSNISAGNLSLSKKFLFIEPYVSYGLIQYTATLSGTGTANLFDGNFPVGTTSINGTGSSGWFQVGVQFKVGFVSLAAEYDNMFLDDTFAARLAFGF